MKKNSKQPVKDDNIKPVVLNQGFIPVFKSIVGFFGNRCSECGSTFDQEGFCNNGHQIVPTY